MALAAALILPGSAGRAEEGQPLPAMFPYAKQGGFVTGPATFLSSPVYGAGFTAGAMVCLPVSLVQDPRMEAKVPREKMASLVCGRGLATALSWPVYAAGGLPFFILKGLFWDGPRALLGRPKPATSS